MTQQADSFSGAPFEVVILGASHAGIEVYYQLRRKRAGRALSLCFIDKQREHGYIPLVHERLLGRAPKPWHGNGVLPTARSVERDPNARFVQDEVVGIDVDGPFRSVRLRSGLQVRARSLVIALGSQLAPPPELPGVEHLTRYKFDAELARARTRLGGLADFTEARNIVVIGGGVSGVELAGELAYALQQQPTAAKVTLLQSADRLLPQLSVSSSRKAQRALSDQGVLLRLGTRLVQVDANTLQLRSQSGQADALAYDVAFWAAGIRPNPLLAELGLALTERSYLAVTPQLQCRKRDASVCPGVYACGDAVRVVDERGEWPTMQRAIECLWEAKVVAQNLLRERRGEALRAHTLWRDFPYGVSLGARSMVVFGALAVHLGVLAVVFRRFLMWAYMHRYTQEVRVTHAAQALPEPQSPQPSAATAQVGSSPPSV